MVGAEGAEGGGQWVRGLLFQLANGGEEEGLLGVLLGEGRSERSRGQIVVGNGGLAEGQGSGSASARKAIISPCCRRPGGTTCVLTCRRRRCRPWSQPGTTFLLLGRAHPFARQGRDRQRQQSGQRVRCRKGRRQLQQTRRKSVCTTWRADPWLDSPRTAIKNSKAKKTRSPEDGLSPLRSAAVESVPESVSDSQTIRTRMAK